MTTNRSLEKRLESFDLFDSFELFDPKHNFAKEIKYIITNIVNFHFNS